MKNKEQDHSKKDDEDHHDDVKLVSKSMEETTDTDTVKKEVAKQDDLTPPHQEPFPGGDQDGRDDNKDDSKNKEREKEAPAKETRSVANGDTNNTNTVNATTATTTTTTTSTSDVNGRSTLLDISTNEENTSKNNSATISTTTVKNSTNSSTGDQESKSTSITEKVKVTSKEGKREDIEEPVVSHVPFSSPAPVLRKDHDHVAKTGSGRKYSPFAKVDGEQTAPTEENRARDDNQGSGRGKQEVIQIDDEKKNNTPIVSLSSTTQHQEKKKDERRLGADETSCHSSSPRDEHQKMKSVTSSKSSPVSHDSPRQKDRGGGISSSAEKQMDNPYLNKKVRVLSGQFEGLTGRIVQVHNRGWWTLDNQQMNGRNIHPRFCELMDEIDPTTINEFYKSRNRTRSLPIIVRRQIERAKRKRGEEDPPTEQGDRKQAAVPLEPRGRGRPPTRRTAALKKRNQDSSAVSTVPVKKQKTGNEVGKSNRSSSKFGSGKKKKVLITSSLKGSLQQHSSAQWDGQHKRASKTNNHVSPPFLLSSQGDDYRNNEALRHLSPEYKVEVFDRKNGRILKGKHAIALNDLHAVLMRHAEYEPIIPPPKSKIQNNDASSSGTNNNAERVFSHEARSSVSARINEHVQPQTRVRASAAEGCRVKIIAGPYCGLTGKIESCIPGNWYLISELSEKNKFDFDYIFHSRHLEILTDSSHQSSKSGAKKKNRQKDPKENDQRLAFRLKKDISTVRQLIDTLEQNKVQVKRDFTQRPSAINAEVKKLDDELRSAKERLRTKELSYKMLAGKN